MASREVITAELCTPDVVVSQAAQGTPKSRDLQTANMALGLQTGLKRCQWALEHQGNQDIGGETAINISCRFKDKDEVVVEQGGRA